MINGRPSQPVLEDFCFDATGAAGGSDSKGRSFFDASVTDSHEPVIADM